MVPDGVVRVSRPELQEGRVPLGGLAEERVRRVVAVPADPQRDGQAGRAEGVLGKRAERVPGLRGARHAVVVGPLRAAVRKRERGRQRIRFGFV